VLTARVYREAQPGSSTMRPLQLIGLGAPAEVTACEVHAMGSIWESPAALKLLEAEVGLAAARNGAATTTLVEEEEGDPELMRLAKLTAAARAASSDNGAVLSTPA
jgi:hypothetical protein